MGKRYKQLTIEERCEIARLYTSRHSIRQIAANLDRTPSTISREINRNRSKKFGYMPIYANQQSRARRWSGSKLDRNSELRKEVFSLLSRGWSPEQVCGWLKKKNGHHVISYETIYRFIYAQIARRKDYRWRLYLPKKKSKRGYRSKKKYSSATFIAHRRSISERNEEVHTRLTPGHWEADLMMFATFGQAVLVLHERYSRLTIAVRLPNKSSQPIADAIKKILAPLPEQWRQTVTFDNGTEFARHYELHKLNIQTFFCDTYSPWQKGGVENAIGRMRRMLPRKTDLATLPEEQFERIVRAYNNTPRKCLDFQTPAELFYNKLLHFKCECSTPLAVG